MTNMKPLISYLASISIIFLFLFSPTSASRIHVGDFTTVDWWSEYAKLTKNNEMDSNVSLALSLNANFSRENITFYFSPVNVIYNKIKDFKVTKCHVTDGVNLNKPCIITEDNSSSFGIIEGRAITVNNTKPESSKTYTFEIHYVLTDAVKQYGNLPIIDKFGKFYLLSIYSSCWPSKEKCPSVNDFNMIIKLPSENSIWDRVTDGVKIVDTNTVSINSQGYYQIWWTDAVETENWVPFIWVTFSILLGAVLSAPTTTVLMKLYNFLKGRVCPLNMVPTSNNNFFTDLVNENKNIDEEELKLILDKTLSFEDTGINTHFGSLLGGLMALIGVLIGIAISPQSSISGMTIPIMLMVVALAFIYCIVRKRSKEQYYVTRSEIITNYGNAKQELKNKRKRK